MRLDPRLLLQPVQSRIERALLHLQGFFRYLLDTFGDCPAMQRPESDGLENQQVERALHEIAWLSHTMAIYNIAAIVDSQGVHQPSEKDNALAGIGTQTAPGGRSADTAG